MTPEDWKMKYYALERTHKRYKKKSSEAHRLDCRWRSKDGSVFVCDKDGGPARCNANTKDDCPYAIMMKELDD